jgi:predicted nucleic acid-binding protein
MSVPLAFEYETVLLRPEHRLASGFSEANAVDFVLSLLGVADRIRLGPYVGPISPDAGDRHVLNLAADGRADAIVTQNLRHFRAPCETLGVDLFTPAQFLGFIRKGRDGSDDPDRT